MDMQDKILKLKYLLQKTGLEGESGSIIYSADSTLKEGKFYFLGTNPAGNRLEYPDTIMNQINLSKEKNEYIDGNWSNKQHQQTIKSVFRELGIDLEKTFSTNTSFIRSPGEQKYLPRYPIDCEQIKFEVKAKKQLKKDGRETFWPIQEYFLSIVKPKLVIANGSMARDLFWNKIMNSEFSGSKVQKENTFEYSNSANKFCYFFKGDLRTENLYIQNLNVLSLPHLSFQDYSFHKLGVEWAKKKISSFIE